MSTEPPSRRPTLPPVGAVFAGRYQIRRQIAAGSMGAVYEAVDPSTGGAVALKVLRPDLAADAALYRRFRRESSILAALDDPAIVRIYDVGSDDQGRAYTAMELLDGETLRSRLQRVGRMDPVALLPIVVGVCRGLSVAHDHGVVHRDLKPANIFLRAGDPTAPVTLVDFGLSKVHGLERLTRTGEVIGTPAYMAPELLTGDGAPDGRIDTYALGVIAYEALSGRLPFTERNPGKLMFDVVTGKSEPLRRVAAWVSEALEQVVRHAMASQVAERYTDPSELAQAFRMAVEEP